MPLNRELLRKVQALLSRASRGLSKAEAAAEEETSAAMISARWASNAAASTSMTFASSIPLGVRRSPLIAASLLWHDRSDHTDPFIRGREISLITGGELAHRRSFFTRTSAPLPTAAVAAGGSGGERNGKKRNSSSKERRRSSSSLSTSRSTPKRRILPSEMPRLPPLPRGGKRQWRTLLEDEVRRKRGWGRTFLFEPLFLRRSSFFLSSRIQSIKQKQHPLREEDIPPEIRAIMDRLREAGEFLILGLDLYFEDIEREKCWKLVHEMLPTLKMPSVNEKTPSNS